MRKTVLVCAGLALITALVYVQVAGHEFLSFDDELYVTGNVNVLQGFTARGVEKAFSLTGSTYWHPLTMLSHTADVALFGLSPAGHHLMNLLFHLAAVVLLFLALSRMTGRIWISAFIAALFALHPLNVETVAWVAQRKNVLWGLFFSAGLLAWSRYAQKPALPAYLAACAAFVLGLLSKPTMITFPFVLLLLDYWPLGRLDWGQSREGLDAPPGASASPGRLLVEKIPLFAILALGLGLAVWSNRQFGMAQQAADSGLLLRLANLPVAYAIYLAKLAWPSGLAVFHPMPASVPAWQILASLAVLALVTALSLWQARRRPYLLVGWLWFCGTLFPMAGLVHTGLWPQWADRWAYVPAVGLFLAASFGLARALAPRAGAGLAVAAGLVLAALSVATVLALGAWKDDSALFTRALENTTDNYVAYNTLARVAAKQKDFVKAEEYFRKTMELQPGYYEAYNDLGVALLNQNRGPEAAERFRQALSLKPDFFRALNNLGIALAKQEKYEEAVAEFEKALAVKPDYLEAHGNLAFSLGRLGRLDEAIAHDEAALAIDPSRVQSRVNLGDIHFLKGELEKARDQYATALAIYPQIPRAHYELGRVLAKLGQPDEAAKRLEAALALAPDHAYPEANLELGKILEAKGLLSEARDRYKEALRLMPSLAEAREALARIPDNRMAQALAQLEQELEKNPKNPVIMNRLGNLHKNQGDLDKALEIYTRALDVAPGSAAVLNNIGSVHMAKKEYDQAREWFEKAIQAAPQLIPALYNMACLYSLTGDPAQSAQWLQKAADLGFTSWDAVEGDPDLAALRRSPHYQALKRTPPAKKAS